MSGRPRRRHDDRGEDLPCSHARRSGRDDNGALTVSEIYARAAPGVVQITSTAAASDNPSSFDQQLQAAPQQALGSGFVIDKTGHIVTNYHVIEGADQIEVSFSNQDTLSATIVGSDPSTDIAVLRVQSSSRGLAPLAFGNSDNVRVGDHGRRDRQPVRPRRTATAGIVSAVQERTITAPNGYPIDHVIQTDAQINSGNSGGPLLNARGEVIGVNSQIARADGSTGNVGIGFAVPSNTVKEVVAQLTRPARVDRAYLGISGSTVDGRARPRLPAPGRRGRARRRRRGRQPGREGRPPRRHDGRRRRRREPRARRRRDRRGRRPARRLVATSCATRSPAPSRVRRSRSRSTAARRSTRSTVTLGRQPSTP